MKFFATTVSFIVLGWALYFVPTPKVFRPISLDEWWQARLTEAATWMPPTVAVNTDGKWSTISVDKQGRVFCAPEQGKP